MRALLLGIAAIFMAVPAAAAEPVASVTVERDGSHWTAEYELAESAPVWVFSKSVLPREAKRSWRIDTVRVLTPGVTLQRLGHYDALVAASGTVPKRVQLKFTPFFDDIEAGYDPALAFGNGAVALYTSAFKIVPMPSAAAAAQASANSDQLPLASRPTHIDMRDGAGDVLFMGERTDAALIDDYDAYVIFGDAAPQVGEAMVTILDPGIPLWLRSFISKELPPVLESYRRQLGPAPVGKPMVMASWAGAQQEGASFGGSVLPGTVVMTLSGKRLLKHDPKISNYARWLVAHEAAHFWLGQAVRYSSPAESWITEGGAELLAYRATAATDPAYDVKTRFSEAREECIPFLRNGGIAQAFEREGDHRAYYACGLIIALAAEKANGGDFGGFVKDLIERNRADGVVSRSEWFALIEEKDGTAGVTAAVAGLLDHPQPDPKRALAKFITAAGIGDQFAAKGATR